MKPKVNALASVRIAPYHLSPEQHIRVSIFAAGKRRESVWLRSMPKDEAEYRSLCREVRDTWNRDPESFTVAERSPGPSLADEIKEEQAQEDRADERMGKE